MVNPPIARYCDRFGYDFIALQGSLDTSRPPAWSKIVALRRVLPNYDWVFWCDTDAVLWRPDVGLRQFVACADSAVILQANHEAPNSGLFFIRNCPWSFHFLDEVYRQEQFIHHPCWENMAIIELLNKEEIRSRVHVYPKQQLPGGFHGFRYYNDWDKIFIHHPGMGDSRHRLWLIDNLVRLVEMDAARRMITRADLGPLLNRLGLLGEGVEVGVEAGEFAATVLNSWEGRRLHLVRRRRPRRFLEVGTYRGYTTRILAKKFPDMEIVTVDPGDQVPAERRPGNQAGEYLDQDQIGELVRDYVNVRVIKRAFQEIDWGDARFEMIFIDGNHSFAHVLADSRVAMRLVTSPGVIVWHDFNNVRDVNQAQDQFTLDGNIVSLHNTWIAYHDSH